MKNKIKFIPCDTHFEFFNGNLKLSKNPTKYHNLPDGEYYIRGNVKGRTKRYIVYQGKWYYTRNFQFITNLRDYFMAEFLLFPNLPEKEYEIMFKMYNRLSKEWKLNCDAKTAWIKSRVNERSFEQCIRKTK